MSRAIRDSARGENCTVQIYPYCRDNPETVVLAHLPSEDHGMALKSPDFWAAYACDLCHSIIDGREKTVLPAEEIRACMYRGLYRTQKRLIEKGLMKVKGQ